MGGSSRDETLELVGDVVRAPEMNMAATSAVIVGSSESGWK